VSGSPADGTRRPRALGRTLDMLSSQGVESPCTIPRALVHALNYRGNRGASTWRESLHGRQGLPFPPGYRPPWTVHRGREGRAEREDARPDGLYDGLGICKFYIVVRTGRPSWRVAELVHRLTTTPEDLMRTGERSSRRSGRSTSRGPDAKDDALRNGCSRFPSGTTSARSARKAWRGCWTSTIGCAGGTPTGHRPPSA